MTFRPRLPAALTDPATPIPRPRLLGFLAGILVLLLLLPLSRLVFGGTDLGPDGPSPSAFLAE